MRALINHHRPAQIFQMSHKSAGMFQLHKTLERMCVSLSFTDDCNDRQSVCKSICFLSDQIKQFLYVSHDQLLVLREKKSITQLQMNSTLLFFLYASQLFCVRDIVTGIRERKYRMSLEINECNDGTNWKGLGQETSPDPQGGSVTGPWTQVPAEGIIQKVE